MKKTTDAAPSSGAIQMPLDEYCARLSMSDRRVALISGFHADARQRKQVKDTEASFAKAFSEYSTRPVN